MKFFKASALAIMIAAAALFACSEQPGSGERGDAGTGSVQDDQQGRGYFGDEDKQEGVNPQNPDDGDRPRGTDDMQPPPGDMQRPPSDMQPAPGGMQPPPSGDPGQQQKQD